MARHDDDVIACGLDVVAFDHKPNGNEIAGITRRLERSGFVNVTIDELLNAVVGEGRTWTPGAFAPSDAGGWGEFAGVRIIGLDFDNKSGADDLGADDPRCILPHMVSDRLRECGIVPLAAYPTASATAGRPKFRVMVDLGETLTDRDEAEATITLLLRAFPEADQACKNVNRLFFGCCGEWREMVRWYR